MNAPTRLPDPPTVLRAHFRAIGGALRIPMLLAVACAVVGTVLLLTQTRSGDTRLNLHAEPSSLPGIIGALLAVAVWAREERFGPAFLWTLPVDRQQHALLKTLAGWCWLMIGMALYTLVLLVVALASDGAVFPVETLRLVTTPFDRSVPVDPATVQMVQWTPGGVLWLIPFAGATATYLLASAIVVGVRHLLRWTVAAVLAVPLLSGASHVASRMLDASWLAYAPERFATSIVCGRFGLELLLTLRTWTLDTRVTLATGERVHVWSAVPSLADWSVAALLWTGAGALALWFAASRHRERRRR